MPAVLLATGDAGWWILLPWLTIPLAVRAVRDVLGGLSGRELNRMLARSGQLQLLFGVLLAAGLIVG